MRPRNTGQCGRAEGGVDFLKRLSVPLQADEERGVAEVDAAADDHVVPFGLVVGAPEATCPSGVEVGAKLACVIDPDGHSQGGEVVDRLASGSTERSADETDHTALRWLKTGVALAVAATDSPRLQRSL